MVTSTPHRSVISSDFLAQLQVDVFSLGRASSRNVADDARQRDPWRDLRGRLQILYAGYWSSGSRILWSNRKSTSMHALSLVMQLS